MGISKSLSGTPWHIETLRKNEDEKRRHKSNCKYYDNITKKCHSKYYMCTGSAHCKFYEEKHIKNNIQQEQQMELINNEKNQLANDKSKKDNNSPVKYADIKYLLVGTDFIHKKYGIGELIEKTDKIITIKFQNDIEKFPYPEAMQQKYLVRIRYDFKSLKIGTIFRHESLGKGTLTFKDENYIVIDFNGEFSSFDLSNIKTFRIPDVFKAKELRFFYEEKINAKLNKTN